MNVDPKNWPEAAALFSLLAGAAKPGFLYARDELRESDDGSKLYIGRAGTGGIEFAYRRAEPGIWAWYPIDNDLTPVADTLDARVSGWADGSIKV